MVLCDLHPHMNFQGIGQVWAWQCGYGASAAALIIPTSNDSSIIFQRARAQAATRKTTCWMMQLNGKLLTVAMACHGMPWHVPSRSRLVPGLYGSERDGDLAESDLCSHCDLFGWEWSEKIRFFKLMNSTILPCFPKLIVSFQPNFLGMECAFDILRRPGPGRHGLKLGYSKHGLELVNTSNPPKIIKYPSLKPWFGLVFF